MFGLPISLNTLTLLNYINTLLVNVIIRKQDLCSDVKSNVEKHLFFLRTNNFYIPRKVSRFFLYLRLK